VSNCLGSQYFTPSGNRKLSAKFIIIGALVNLTLNLILIPRFWGYGAIVASLIAERVITVLYFRYCSGYLTMDTFIREGWKKLIAGIVMLAVIKLIDRVITSNAAALVVEVAAGFTVYCVMILALRDTFISEIVLGKILKRGKSA
jgi:O-antigen/teichoic acid export membrane protein